VSPKPRDSWCRLLLDQADCGILVAAGYNFTAALPMDPALPPSPFLLPSIFLTHSSCPHLSCTSFPQRSHPPSPHPTTTSPPPVSLVGSRYSLLLSPGHSSAAPTPRTRYGRPQDERRLLPPRLQSAQSQQKWAKDSEQESSRPQQPALPLQFVPTPRSPNLHAPPNATSPQA